MFLAAACRVDCAVVWAKVDIRSVRVRDQQRDGTTETSESERRVSESPSRRRVVVAEESLSRVSRRKTGGQKVRRAAEEDAILQYIVTCSVESTAVHVGTDR